MSDEFQPDNWPEEYFESPPLEQIIGHGNEHGTINVYRGEGGVVWHTTHERCDYHGPTGPRTSANFRLTEAQEFAIVEDLSKHLPVAQRRALLARLLESEGLPGVEEIEGFFAPVPVSERQQMEADNERLRRELDEAKKQLRVWFNADGSITHKNSNQVMEDRKAAAIHLDALLVENADLKEDLEESERACEEVMGERDRWVEELNRIALESGLSESEREWSNQNYLPDTIIERVAWLQSELESIRQTRLHELLEAEARERVEVEEDEVYIRFRIDSTRSSSTLRKSDLHIFGCPLFEFTPDSIVNLTICFLAALSEKRRRELADSIPLEEMIDVLGIREEVEAESRRREGEDIIAACEYCEATVSDTEDLDDWHCDDDAIWTCPKCTAESMVTQDRPFRPNWANHPGNTLRDIIEKHGWSWEEAEEHTGLFHGYIKAVCERREPITALAAERLGEYGISSEQFWLNRQRDYDEAIARGVPHVS